MRAIRLAARALRATHLVDRAYRKFVSLRSRLVLAAAPPRFYDAYNDVSYASQGSYEADSSSFRSDLFPWEDVVIKRHFPPPPGTILIGAAGGGRESFALSARGYDVVAFEPARPLAESMARRAGDDHGIEVLIGRYEDLPRLASLSQPAAHVDLRERPSFSAAILGWASLSHLRSDGACVAALASFGALTAGPILISYFSRIAGRQGASNDAEFSIEIGYYRPFPEGHVGRLAADAGLRIVEEDHYSGWSVLTRT